MRYTELYFSLYVCTEYSTLVTTHITFRKFNTLQTIFSLLIYSKAHLQILKYKSNLFTGQ